MSQYVYTMNRVGKVVPPQKTILKDISLSFFPGAKIGVLGLNGSGKSTLLRIMAGLDTDILGEARAQTGIQIGYLAQEPKLDSDHTVRQAVEVGLGELMSALQRFDEISNQFAEPMDDDTMTQLLNEQAGLQDKIDATNGWDMDRTLEMAADSLRLPPWDQKIAQLSGGERRRVALCALMLSKPDMILLDEPTNHLDAESVAWLERFLCDFPGTVVAVTHDRYFLDNAAEWILELDRGQGIPFEGNYTSWLEQKEQRIEREQRQEDAWQKTIKAELEWVRANPKGRQAKSKARLKQYEELASQEFQKRNETAQLYIPPGPRLGDQVIQFSDVGKKFADRWLYENLNFDIPKGAIVGIIGPNGAGKTTLFKMITGEATPDLGTVTIGDTVELAYVDQSRDALDNTKTVWEEVSGGLDYIQVGQSSMPSRAYVGRFNFKGNDQQKRVGDLSGGERNRLHLAKLLQKGANVILLDEPTNDLDVETLRALEEALLAYPGCILVISHDRWFLDRVATHILSFEDEAQVEFFEGSYTEFEQYKRQKYGEQAAQPKRPKYKFVN